MMNGEPTLGGRRSRFLAAGAAGALMLAAPVAGAQEVKDGGPFVPTPHKVVEAMLDLAAVRPKDFVMDLGSGDGRIVLTAATRHKARGIGVDIDQELVDRANASARRLGVAGRVKFVRQDVRQADLSRATVLALYLLPGMMSALRPKFLAELRPGTRIVSHDFELGEWKPDRTIEVETPEKYDLSGAWTSSVHLWIVPASVEGSWRGSGAGENGARLELELSQSYQRVQGRLTRAGGRVSLRDGVVEGRGVRFSVARSGGGTETWIATVDGDRMSGEIRGEGAASKWSAERAR
ncbi:MAG: class I SAM-dependent methyltransferase [Burkholderiales bacterium]|nr:class I SAM-dependent methyltransferase [Burkholderiales bacterium]